VHTNTSEKQGQNNIKTLNWKLFKYILVFNTQTILNCSSYS